MFCKLISDKFNDWEFVYVDYKLNYDFVENCYLSIIPTFYVINADNISEKEQNVILKIFEEPPNNINIILLSSSSTLLLPTILNRAVVWEFDLYSKETLKSFNNEMSDSVLDLVSTPGQLLELTNI